MGKEFKKTTAVLGIFDWDQYEAVKESAGLMPDFCHDAIEVSAVADRVCESRLRGRVLFVKTADLQTAECALKCMLPNTRNGRVQLANALRYLTEGQVVKVHYPASCHKGHIFVEPVTLPAPVARNESVETGPEQLAA